VIVKPGQVVPYLPLERGGGGEVRKFALFALFGVRARGARVAAGNLGIPPVVITREGEQKVVLLFGDVRDVTQPGISLAIPFVEEIRTYPSSWLYNSTDAKGIQTQDGEQLVIDNYTGLADRRTRASSCASWRACRLPSSGSTASCATRCAR
jgi:hypothetical protein